MPPPSIRTGRAYRPGTLVPVSGMYSVVHQQHRAPHEVIAIRGEEFPSCRICANKVRFYVVQVAAHMTHDFDLAGLPFDVFKVRAKAASKGAAD